MSDPVNHPAHYGKGRFSIECIEITRHMTFNAGNAVKYIWRHAEKNGEEDLEKAVVYLGWAFEDMRPAILPGREEYVHGLLEQHVLERIELGSAYQAIVLVADNRFDSAKAHLECVIDGVGAP